MCEKCNSYIDSEYKFCPYCGNNLFESKVDKFKEDIISIYKKYNMAIRFNRNEYYEIVKLEDYIVNQFDDMSYNNR